MYSLRKKSWYPVLAGIAFAVILIFSFILSNRPLGASRAYTTIGSIIEYALIPDHSEGVSYWDAYTPYIDWSIAVLLGIMVGSFISSVYSRDFRVRAVPEMWKTSRGPSVAQRWFWALIGGVIIGFAARLSGGCVSGMLISGVSQLAPSGFLFMMSLWIGGIVTTLLFYKFKTYTFKRG